jgi:hypothetical protein
MPEGYIDRVTGRELPFHEDEYIRQEAERLLMEERGWPAERIGVEVRRSLAAAGREIKLRADLALAAADGGWGLVIRCARGSLVSRERETVAAARLLASPVVPWCLVFNGDDAELIRTADAEVAAAGLAAVPTPEELELLVARAPAKELSPQELTQAAQVYEAYSLLQCPGVCRDNW